jgi:hypothetical protein
MAAGLTYEPIQTYSASGSQSSVTFNPIAGTYTDLILVISGNTAAITTALRFNNDTGNNYGRSIMRGDGSTPTSTRQSAQSYLAIDGSVSQPLQNAEIHIQNYANATTYKQCLARSNNAGAGLDFVAGSWTSTAAITRLDVLSAGGTNYTAGTTFTLYGLAKA